MTRRRGNAMDLRPPLSTYHKPEMRLLVTVVFLLVIGECQGDGMMGGHLDNKETDGGYVMEHRSDEDPNQVSSRTSSRLAVDSDFDLELDLLAEHSALDSNNSNGGNATATISDESDTAPRYRVLPYAFNGGQPFSLEKDPITGQIDFEKAPPLKALEYNVKNPVENDEDEAGPSAEERIDENVTREDVALGPNEINPYSPSFHDFLNLPVRYSYDKYENAEKYPLISSSYANTKVQSGPNSYNTYNHKKYHETVKAGVDVQTLYVQPSRKTYHESVTRTSPRPTSIASITEKTSTTTRTTAETTTVSSTTSRPSYTTRSPNPTTWKPKQSPNRAPNIYGIYGDYEATLPIERLQQASNADKETTTEVYAPPTPEDSRPNSDNGADYEGYDEDYDRILQIADRPSSQEENASQDYAIDIAEDSRPKETAPPSSTTRLPATNATTTQRPSTTVATTRFSTTNSEDEDRTDPTTSRPLEEKRVTSMPIDEIGYGEDYRVTGTSYSGNPGVLATNDNTIPSIANALYQNSRPGSSGSVVGDNYYGRPASIGMPIGMPAGGIVVKSTSNVVVPPGQDTVSFVVGNHQSVGSVSDADFYGIRAPSSLSNTRPNVSFGKIGPSRPGVSQMDNYSSQMIVSAGIGVGTAPIGSYHQRQPIPGGDGFDHAVVTVGMPTVHVASPGESGGSTVNKNPDAATSSLETRPGQTWWASTGTSANSQQSESQDSTGQKFGYRVVFPDDKTPGGPVENSAGTARPIEEHVIVVHESELGNGNAIRLDLSSNPTTGYHPDSPTTQRLPVNSDDKPLPELSESLTPPAERPNILPSGIQRPPPTYNYYHHHHHHHHHSPGNSRPSDYRDQRPPQRGPLSQQSTLPASGGNAFKRRPATPPVDSNLPNILPQFRPNAKTSHGHNRGETIGTIAAGGAPSHAGTRIRRPPPQLHQQHHHHHRSPTSRRPVGPPHLQRLNPPPLPPPPPPINALRLPTPVPLIASSSLGLPTTQHEIQSNENSVRLGGPQNGSLHKVSIGVPPSLSLDERHRQTVNGFVAPQTIKSGLEDDNLERFSAEPPIRPPYFTKRTSGGDNDGVPRIATLQMIQHVGSRDEDTSRPSLPSLFRFDNNEKKASNGEDEREDDQARDEATGEGASADRRGDDEATRTDYVDTPDSPVYIVYPAKGTLDTRSNVEHERDDASVILGTYGSQRPLPPDTLLQDSAESAKDTYGASTSVAGPSYPESPRPQLASDFPYPLEIPDPSMFTSQLRETPLLVPSEQRKSNDRTEPSDNTSNGESGILDVVRDNERDASVNVIPYLQDHVPFALKENAGAISATLHRLSSSAAAASSTPIAYVYTPTTGRPVRRQDDPYVNLERTGPILLPSQQASSSSSSAPSPQSFMAPFVASASAEATSKNGWSVVVPGPEDSTNRRRHDNAPQRETEAKQSGAPVEDDNDEDSANDHISDVTKSSETTGTDETIDSQTEKNEFDVENFTPQLFGGFRPIFEFPSDDETDPSMADKPKEESASIAERPRSETG